MQPHCTRWWKRPRSALGVGTIIAVGLLLVAACFGLLASNGWH
ncbi:hypothetical protein [Dokdonella fugitiva]|jgi:hypothetical protein|uniref:Uncharacterized protein n=1 Tax=Dokdonella fugitiva TaxID=328517 RepID=A0A4R2ICP1_9GAMM|nr:hypothetical protein [Dokdonella fugitiva]MBA8883187.1 hypothetical protein [Dokdonella fugitiva]TCO40355.1 hypothetical protein EV148_105150 [Dokdonella fugitiva]